MKKIKRFTLWVGIFSILTLFLLSGLASASVCRLERGNPVSSFGAVSPNKSSSIFKRTDGANQYFIPAPEIEASFAEVQNNVSTNTNGNSSPPTINLNLYINPMYINIEGDDIFQANGFSAEEIAEITQDGELNIATIVQNIVQVGVNMNVSPQINVILVGEQVVAPDVVVNTPDITVELPPESGENGGGA
ncbi:MAG: hypothetical protein PWP60_300 [Candidatus Atribacteria bacterium]|jgi:hypothetical protein|uniref:hypothetical protein n=1 Tax=Atrimonas thermophila TaxID=3064161 RepID=UPI0024AA1C6D|nr:hypothetical protein [Candidatus Atribacteria bacterium]MDI3530451.1 hypothetical protein [Candidatus Atribacteria bacterium]